MIDFLKCLWLHDYKHEPQRVVGLKPVYRPAMGVREVVLYMPVCQRCGEMNPWALGQERLGRWVSGGPTGKLITLDIVVGHVHLDPDLKTVLLK